MLRHGAHQAFTSRARCDLVVDTTETQISALPLFQSGEGGEARGGASVGLGKAGVREDELIGKEIQFPQIDTVLSTLYYV